MNEAKSNACRCNPCPGSSCKCGCQDAKTAKAYGCGSQCHCAGVCACAKK